ncbi:MAG: dockerin type I domain-containing protein [Candidatus Paceibacterota bacterium]|jgi:hypothetical protein
MKKLLGGLLLAGLVFVSVTVFPHSVSADARSQCTTILANNPSAGMRSACNSITTGYDLLDLVRNSPEITNTQRINYENLISSALYSAIQSLQGLLTSKPTVFAITPYMGEPGMTVVITGRNFDATDTVVIGGKRVENVSSTGNGTRLQFVIPELHETPDCPRANTAGGTPPACQVTIETSAGSIAVPQFYLLQNYDLAGTGHADQRSIDLMKKVINGQETCPILSCDLNGDTRVDQIDLKVIQNYIAGKTPVLPVAQILVPDANLDLNNDGRVSPSDVQTLENYIAGTQSACTPNKCDLNKDGVVDIVDSQLMVYRTMGTNMIFGTGARFVPTNTGDIKLLDSALDINANGRVDSSDQQNIINFTLGKTSVCTIEKCDLNGDGKVDDSDTALMASRLSQAKFGQGARLDNGVINVPDSTFDVNGDGAFTSTDVSFMYNLSINKPGFSCPASRSCDVNDDGKIDSADAGLIQLRSAGTVYGTGTRLTATAPVSPTITITGPSGGNRLQKGATYAVNWTTTNLPTNHNLFVVVSLYPVGSDTGLPQQDVGLSAHPIASAGTMSWTLPNTNAIPAGEYLLSIALADATVHPEGLIIATAKTDGITINNPTTLTASAVADTTAGKVTFTWPKHPTYNRYVVSRRTVNSAGTESAVEKYLWSDTGECSSTTSSNSFDRNSPSCVDKSGLVLGTKYRYKVYAWNGYISQVPTSEYSYQADVVYGTTPTIMGSITINNPIEGAHVTMGQSVSLTWSFLEISSTELATVQYKAASATNWNTSVADIQLGLGALNLGTGGDTPVGNLQIRVCKKNLTTCSSIRNIIIDATQTVPTTATAVADTTAGKITFTWPKHPNYNRYAFLRYVVSPTDGSLSDRKDFWSDVSTDCAIGFSPNAPSCVDTGSNGRTLVLGTKYHYVVVAYNGDTQVSGWYYQADVQYGAPVVAEPTYQATLTVGGVPANKNVVQNSTFRPTITVKNTGTAVWGNDVNLYRGPEFNGGQVCSSISLQSNSNCSTVVRNSDGSYTVTFLTEGTSNLGAISRQWKLQRSGAQIGNTVTVDYTVVSATPIPTTSVSGITVTPASGSIINPGSRVTVGFTRVPAGSTGPITLATEGPSNIYIAQNITGNSVTWDIPTNFLPGSYGLIVYQSAGGYVRLPSVFTVVTPAATTPTITSLSPATLVAGSNPSYFWLTINGTNFALNSTVTFGGVPVNQVLSSDGSGRARSSTWMVAQVLGSNITAAGSKEVVVTNPDGGRATANFTVTAAAASLNTKSMNLQLASILKALQALKASLK